MTTIAGRDIELSHLDKTFFPSIEATKGDVIDYYRGVADVMIPHMKRYGVSMQRVPNGVEGKRFYQKEAPDYFPDWITTVSVPKRQGGSYRAPVVDDEAALAYLANQAVITPHLYLSRVDDLERPDRMIYDLDPPEGADDFPAARQAARDVRAVLEELDMPAFVQTTGGKGYHVVTPLRPQEDFETVRRFARDVATIVLRRHSDRYTLKERKSSRDGKIFLDTLRNAYGATAVAPYAIRVRPGAPVAGPLQWRELAGAEPQQWNIRSMPRRLAQKDDPWRDIRAHACELQSRREKLDRLLKATEPAPKE